MADLVGREAIRFLGMNLSKDALTASSNSTTFWYLPRFQPFDGRAIQKRPSSCLVNDASPFCVSQCLPAIQDDSLLPSASQKRPSGDGPKQHAEFPFVRRQIKAEMKNDEERSGRTPSYKPISSPDVVGAVSLKCQMKSGAPVIRLGR
jgi:hypothetical protein